MYVTILGKPYSPTATPVPLLNGFSKWMRPMQVLVRTCNRRGAIRKAIDTAMDAGVILPKVACSEKSSHPCELDQRVEK